MEGSISLALRQSRNPIPDPTCAHCSAPDDSHDVNRNVQELTPRSSFWLASPSRPGSVSQTASASASAPLQPTATEGK